MAAAGAGEVGAGEVGEVGVELGVEGVAESHARVPGWCVTRHPSGTHVLASAGPS